MSLESDKYPQWMALMEEIERARRGAELLQEIWLAVGAYQRHQIPNKTMEKMQRFFDFDDSE